MKGKSHCAGNSPCENIKHCCISKPPLVLFTIGLCALVVAFVSLAIYMRDADAISDPNYHVDWTEFLSDLSSKSWSRDSDCVEKKNQPSAAQNITKYDNEISVLVSADILEDLYKSIKSGSAYHAAVYKKTILPKEKNVKKKTVAIISFSLPANLSDDEPTERKSLPDTRRSQLCMRVLSAGMPFLSPDLKTPELCTPAAVIEKPKALYLCDDDEATPDLNIVYAEDFSLKMFLSDHDRKSIHIHLMSTSYFLLVIVATLLLYGLIKRRAHPNVSESTNHLLSNGV